MFPYKINNTNEQLNSILNSLNAKLKYSTKLYELYSEQYNPDSINNINIQHENNVKQLNGQIDELTQCNTYLRCALDEKQKVAEQLMHKSKEIDSYEKLQETLFKEQISSLKSELEKSNKMIEIKQGEWEEKWEKIYDFHCKVKKVNEILNEHNKKLYNQAVQYYGEGQKYKGKYIALLESTRK